MLLNIQTNFNSIIFRFSTVRENTVHSLEEAGKRGADFVEFDVQLTKDKIAVIFHDFHVLVSVAKQHNSSLDLTLASDFQETKTFLNADSDDSSKDNLSDSTTTSTTTECKDTIKDDYYKIAVKDLRLRQLRLLHVNLKKF